MFWVIFSIVILILCVILDKWQKNEDFDQIPGPKGVFLLGNSLDFFMDTVRIFGHFLRLSSIYRRLYKVTLGPKKFVVIHHPEDVETLIVSKNNSKGYLYEFIEPWLRDGLLLSKGKKWQERRKILTYAFYFNVLKQFHPILEENSSVFVNRLRKASKEPRTNIIPHVHEFTLNSICETAMGIKLDSSGSKIGKMYKSGILEIGQILFNRLRKVWLHPNFSFYLTPGGRKYKKILNLFTTFRETVVNKRRGEFLNQSSEISSEMVNENNNDIGYNKKKRLAMLDLLLQAEKDKEIDAAGIGEEVDTFIFEGHDTSATSLQFTFMLLANHEEWQDKIVEECEQIFGSSDRATTMEDLAQMKYLDCCIKESLRLYPPVSFISRKIEQSIKFGQYVVPAGVDCTIILFNLHRRDDQFVEPLAFRPERFLAEPTWHPYSYLPFSAGPRNCIGQKFAMMEMKSLLSSVLRRYRLRPVTRPQDLVFITDFLLRTRDPIYVKFEKRTPKPIHL